MAAIALLPGFASRYVSETFTTSNKVHDDTLSVSPNCTAVSFQVASSSASGTFDILMSMDGGVTYATFMASVAVTDGNIILADAADGPFGMFKLDFDDIAGGSVVVTIQGH